MYDAQHALQPRERISPDPDTSCDWSGLPAEQLRLAGQLVRLQQALAATGSPRGESAVALPAGLHHAATLAHLQGAAQQLDADLRTGLARGAFHYEFQPMYRALTGEVYGYEALLRWTHQGNSVAPSRWISHAAASGLLGGIQASLLGQVAELLGIPGFGGSVSLNWSPAQFADRTEVSAFAARVLALDLDPTRIIIEITDHSAVRDPHEARECLVFLKDLGFKVALDDFGCGRAGFSYLCNLPIDIVKVDGSLVRALSDSPRARMVLGAVVDVAHSLGHLVVAGGIETLDQLIASARLGCGLVQGFLIGAPERQPERARSGDPALFGIR